MSKEGKINIHELPYPALEINKKREIIDLNKLAIGIGTVAGTHCWDTFGQKASITKQDRTFFEKYNRVPEGGIKCTHCRADEALSKQEHIVENVTIGEILWEVHWIPTGTETYIHYGIDITQRNHD